MFDLSGGIVFLSIPSPGLFVSGIASLLVAFLLAICSFFACRHWRKIATTAIISQAAAVAPQPEPEPIITQEIFIEDGRFTLLGSDWQWLADQGVNYICPCCWQPEDLTLRLYRYLPSGHVFLLGRHNCSRPSAAHIDTDALPTVQGGK